MIRAEGAMEERFIEVGGEFDCILAEEFSIYIHSIWPECPHDIGIKLAQLANTILAEDD